MFGCDLLYDETWARPRMYLYTDYGYTCGYRMSVEEVNDRYCEDIWPDY